MKIIRDSKKYTKICPKCLSLNTKPTGFGDLIAPIPEKCKKCGYTGLFPEIPLDEVESFMKKNKVK